VSFGLGSWGLTPWGASPFLLLEEAVAVSTHAVLVTCSRPLRISSALSTGDALNPRTWTVTQVSPVQLFTPILVQKITDRRVLIILREPLASWNYLHTVGSVSLQAENLVLVSLPYSLEFRGVIPATELREPSGPFDLLTTDIVAGSLKTTEAGGYARVYGVDLLRKMIYRRLTTMPGSFFHIPEGEFGVGLKIKGLLRMSSLPSLQRAITEEILREPGVLSAHVALSLGSGLLSIRAKVQTAQGELETAISAS